MAVTFKSDELAETFTNVQTRAKLRRMGVTVENPPAADGLLGGTRYTAPAEYAPLRQGLDALKAQQEAFRMERETFYSYGSVEKVMSKAARDTQDADQKSLLGGAIRNLVSKLFGEPNGADVRIDMPHMGQEQGIASRLGLDTKAGRIKFTVAVTLGLLGTYYLVNSSSVNTEALSQLKERTEQLNAKSSEVTTLTGKLEEATSRADTATSYTKARDAILGGVCQLGEPKTSPENIANAAKQLFSGCEENPIFDTATKAILDGAKK